MIVVAKHHTVVKRLKLADLDGVKSFSGDLVKDHGGRRDIFRIRATDEAGRELVLFLKRNWKPYKKDRLTTFLRRGKVWSIAQQEWENSLALQRAGLTTAALVAYGEDCGLLWEKFSFILTEAATGRQTVQDFLKNCRDTTLRRRVLEELARTIRKMHDAGLASPDLFTRHLFVDETATPPIICFIDMARLDSAKTLSDQTRARDLAALHVTAPLRFVSMRERMRFMKICAGERSRALMKLIEPRAAHLLQRRKFRDFAAK